jgi:hypothetical protein
MQAGESKIDWAKIGQDLPNPESSAGFLGLAGPIFFFGKKV